MKPDEFVKKIHEIVKKHRTHRGTKDWEGIHSDTDELMEETLTELGYGYGIEMIKKTTRWYG